MSFTKTHYSEYASQSFLLFINAEASHQAANTFNISSLPRSLIEPITFHTQAQGDHGNHYATEALHICNITISTRFENRIFTILTF